MSNSITDKFNDLTAATRQYIDATVAYHKLDLYNKAMIAASSSAHKAVIGFILLLGMIFLSVALALYLGTLTGSMALGYLIVGAFYMILCLLCALFMRPLLERSMLRKSSKKFFTDISQTKSDSYENL